jgi:hypothetical protein
VYSPSNRLEALSARHSLDASSIALPLAGLGTRIAAGGAAAGTTAAAGSSSGWWLLALRVFGGGFALGLILSTSGDSTHAAQDAEDRREAHAGATPAAVSTPATPPDDDCDIFCTQSNPLLKPGNAGSDLPGANGPTIASKTVSKPNQTYRIDVENPAPGVRPGQIHLQVGGQKYLYDFAAKEWVGMPKWLRKQIASDPAVVDAIAKGLKYLGMS